MKLHICTCSAEIAGFNSTLRQGNITHHEYIQVCVNLLNASNGRIYISVILIILLLIRLERGEMLG